MITNDAVITGLLAAILGGIFFLYFNPHRLLQRFCKFVPALLLCYFLPSLLTTFNIIDVENSNIYFFASRFLLPAALVLLCLSIDLKAIINLGPKALILLLTGTFGIIIGGPLALLITAWLAPGALQVHDVEAVWRGMTTLAGSWIGGSANQTAMREIFEVQDSIFTALVAVDVLVANVWVAVLLVLASKSRTIDQRRGVDTRALDLLQQRVETLEIQTSRTAGTPDLIFIFAVSMGATGLAHLLGDGLAQWFQIHFPQWARYSLTSNFFWLVVIATTIGIGLSFTGARNLEGVGASKIGTVFIYILVTAIGTNMDIGALREAPVFFLLGAIWLGIHAGLMLLVCKWLKAPLFFMAVGSQANVGGAASAPVVAAAFHPSLAPVGVLLAVVGYALGTYGAWLCGQLLRLAATTL